MPQQCINTVVAHGCSYDLLTCDILASATCWCISPVRNIFFLVSLLQSQKLWFMWFDDHSSLPFMPQYWQLFHCWNKESLIDWNTATLPRGTSNCDLFIFFSSFYSHDLYCQFSMFMHMATLFFIKLWSTASWSYATKKW